MNLQLRFLSIYGLKVFGIWLLSWWLFRRAQRMASKSIKKTGTVRDDVPADGNVVLEIYRQKYLNFRHFDTLRWGVHTVVIGAAGLVASYAEKATEPSDARYVPILILLFGVFSGLGWWLLYRLVYNQMKNSFALKDVAERIGDLSVPPVSEKPLPTLSSAAFLFMAFVGTLGGIAFVFAFLRLSGLQ